MRIALSHIGKKYHQRWLFRDINLTLQTGDQLALTGTNGSGKSTLLRICARQLSPSEGKVEYFIQDKVLSPEVCYRHLSWAAPYIDVYEDLTLGELSKFYYGMCDCLLQDPKAVIAALDLEAHQDKQLRHFSSGMLQRVRVGLAVFTRSHILLLDEPTSHMDADNARRMLHLIEDHLGDRIYILASNMEREYQQIENRLALG